MNATNTPIAEQGASRSAVKCLFPDDKANDDFLSTPLNNSFPGLMPNVEALPSPMTALSNDFNQSCTIGDNKSVPTIAQNGPSAESNRNVPGLQTSISPLQQHVTPLETSPCALSQPHVSPLKPSALAQSLAQTQPSPLMQPTQNTENFIPPKAQETNQMAVFDGSPFVPSSGSAGGLNGSFDITPHTNEYANASQPLQDSSSHFKPYDNSLNNSAATIPAESGDQPFLYNPSSFPSSDIVGGNLQNNIVGNFQIHASGNSQDNTAGNTHSNTAANLQNNTASNLQNSTAGNLQNNIASQPQNISKPTTLNGSQNRVTNYHANLQFANPMSSEADNTNKHDDSPLFIPQMYNSAQSSSSASTFFVPQAVPETNTLPHMSSPVQNGSLHQPSAQGLSSPSPTTYAPPPLNPPPHSFPTDPYGGSHLASPPSYNDCVMPDNNAMYDISPLGHKQGKGNGILSWFKGAASWSSGANTLKQYMKTATDSVLTTLDPGMKDYLSPGLHLHTVSQNSNDSVPLLVGLKEGFRCALHSEPNIQTHMMNSMNTALLPIGFEGGMQGITNQLDFLKSCVQNDATWGHVVVASQVFVTELVAGKWYVMYCFGLEDMSKELLLHTFSQPIPLPLGCMTSAYQYIQYNAQGECLGYNRSVDDIVRSQLHFERDWCLALSGTPLQQVILTAVQCLAYDYQRHCGNTPAQPPQQQQQPQHVGSDYNNYHNTTDYYPQHQPQQQPQQQQPPPQQQQQPPPPPMQLQYGLSIDAIS